MAYVPIGSGIGRFGGAGGVADFLASPPGPGTGTNPWVTSGNPWVTSGTNPWVTSSSPQANSRTPQNNTGPLAAWLDKYFQQGSKLNGVNYGTGFNALRALGKTLGPEQFNEQGNLVMPEFTSGQLEGFLGPQVLNDFGDWYGREQVRGAQGGVFDNLAAIAPAALLAGGFGATVGFGGAGSGLAGAIKSPVTAAKNALSGTFGGGGATSAPGTFAGYASQFSPAYTGSLGPASGGVNALASAGGSLGGSTPAFNQTLGIGAQDLYSPASLGEASLGGSYSIPGGGFVSERGLGIVPNLGGGVAVPGVSPPVAVPGAGWEGTTSLPGGGFVNPSAIGATPADLYNPISLGGAPTNSLLDTIRNQALKTGAKTLAQGLLSPPVGGEAGGGGGPAPAGAAGIPLLGAGGGFGGGPGNFEFPLGAQGGEGTSPVANALRATAGAGKMQPRPGRVPGYQYRPFANYVM